jgi:hypothetical protein
MSTMHSPKGWRVLQGRRVTTEVGLMCSTLSMIQNKKKVSLDGELKKTRMSTLIKTLTMPLVLLMTLHKKTNFS